jgi:hypothetical protein
MHLRWSGSLLSSDVWPAVSNAAEVLAAAQRQAAEILRNAEAQASDAFQAAQIQSELAATQARVAAQREVWEGVLGSWLDFVERVHSQRAEAQSLALHALKTVVARLKLDASTEQQMTSSVALVLEHHMHSSTGELRVSTQDAPAARAVLDRMDRADLTVAVSPSMPAGACVLRCGELSFETEFESNMQLMLDALEQVACSANVKSGDKP